MPPKRAHTNELQFVVTTNPNDASSAANRRRVRSQAALNSWPERRKRTFQQLEEGGNLAFFHSRPIKQENRTPKPAPTPPPTQVKLETGVQTEIQVYQPIPHLPTASPSPPATIAALEETILPLSPCTRASTPEMPCVCPQCRPQNQALIERNKRPKLNPPGRKRLVEEDLNRGFDLNLITPPASPSPPPPVSQMADPFNCYPVPYKPWYDNLLHHMLTVFGPRAWPALKITTKEGLDWEWLMTQHALAEPAFFYVRLLFASGDMIRLKVLHPEVAIRLRSEAIKTINEALQDPKRAISTPLILAVGRIAFNEFLYGDRNAANTIHRPAQSRMIRMRGGLKALELSPLVKRLMRMTDTVMAKQGGTERFIEDEEEEQSFSMEASVNAVEKWSPETGQVLRRHIRIADIVND